MSAGRYLLDTHTLLWAFYAPERLSIAARQTILDANELYVSIITPWKIALKFSRGGFGNLAVPESWEKSLMREMDSQGYHQLPVETRHCRLVQDLPKHHKDPFDRMMIAQAIDHKLAVISSDDKFGQYRIEKIW